MSAFLAMAFFGGIFVFSAWVIAATLLPQAERIAFLLRHGPLHHAPLPQPARIKVRPRVASARVRKPARDRAAA